MTTRRECASESTERDSTPAPPTERDRRAPALAAPKLVPIWPAFFAARITWPMKLLDFPRRACRRGCGRAGCAGRRRGSSWSIFPGNTGGDGRRSAEFVGISGESASRATSGDAGKSEPNQPHAPGRRRRFSLAVRGSVILLHPLFHARTCDMARQTAIEAPMAARGGKLRCARRTKRPFDCGANASNRSTARVGRGRPGCLELDGG